VIAPTAPISAATEVAPVGEEQIYVVQVGDSLGAIADRFGLSVAELVAANELENPDFVFSGQRLTIPPKGQTGNQGSGVATSTALTTTAAGQGIRIGALETPGNLLSEAVSLINDSNLAVNLQGWRLEREGGPTYTFGSVSLFPGGSLWLHSREGSNTSIALFWSQTAPVWQSGTVARLVNPQGDIVTSYIVP
jgi:LysM repeat protein